MSVLNAIQISKRPARAFFIIGIYWGAFAAQVPVIKENIGANDAVFGLTLLASSLGLVSSMWLAPKMDQWVGARGMQIGAVAFALAWMLPALMSTPWAFALAILGVGLASGVLDVIMNARVSDLEAQTGKPLMNANHGMFSVGYAVSAIATGVARDGGTDPIVVFACLGIVTLILSRGLTMAPDHTDDHTDSEASMQGSMSGIIWICGLIVLVAFMTEATVETWSALHVERTLGGSVIQGALGPAMLGLTMAVGRFAGQAVSERFEAIPVICAASLMAAIGAILAATAASPAMAYLGFGTMGLGISVVGPLGLAIVGQRVPAQSRANAIAKVAVLGFAGFFVAPVLMGFVSELVGLRWAYAMVAGLALLAIPLALSLRR